MKVISIGVTLLLLSETNVQGSFPGLHKTVENETQSTLPHSHFSPFPLNELFVWAPKSDNSPPAD